MNMIRIMLMSMVMLMSPAIFADEAPAKPDKIPSDKPCAMVAKACSDAGFTRKQSADKGIWQNCMMPVVMGKAVSGVKVDPEVVKSCRAKKISELKMQLEQLEKAS